MSLSISLNGINYKGWDEAVVVRNIEAVASSFSFSTTRSSEINIPIKEGDKVQILVDNKYIILTGWVDEIDESYDPKTHTIKITGRSLTSDLVDCSVPFVKDYEFISLFDLCKIVAKPFNIEVVDKVGLDVLFDVFGQINYVTPLRDIISSELGQTAFKFLELYARNRQVLLTDDELGNLVIARATTLVSKNTLRNIVGDPKNNIKSGRRKVNISDLYGQYTAQLFGYPIDLAYARLGVSPLDAGDDPLEDVLEDSATVFDEEIRATRLYEFFPEEDIDEAALPARAEWEKAIRRSRNFTYTAVIQGHSANDEVWTENMLYPIRDVIAKINGEYLCKKITYKFSVKGGSESILDFTTKNAYTLESGLDKIIIDEF